MRLGGARPSGRSVVPERPAEGTYVFARFAGATGGPTGSLGSRAGAPVASIRLRISRTATERVARSDASPAFTSPSTCTHRSTAVAFRAIQLPTRSPTG